MSSLAAPATLEQETVRGFVAQWSATLAKAVVCSGASCPRVRLVLGIASYFGESSSDIPFQRMTLEAIP